MAESRFFRFVDTKLSNPANLRLANHFHLLTPMVAAGLLAFLTYLNRTQFLSDRWFFTWSGVVAVVVALAAYVKHLVSEKEKRDQKASKLAEEQKILTLEAQVREEGQKATAHMLSQWVGISDLLAGALTKTRKRFESQHNPLVLYGELSEFDGYFNTIIALAEAVFPATCGKMQVTLALPDPDRECLQVVHGTPERAQAPSGQKIPLKGKNVPKWGAAQAFLTGQPFYAEDVSLHQVSGRPYQSVLSVPVLDSSGNVLAVVNINSDQLSPFGPEDSPGAATFLLLIDPSMKALSIGAYLRSVVP